MPATETNPRKLLNLKKKRGEKKKKITFWAPSQKDQVPYRTNKTRPSLGFLTAALYARRNKESYLRSSRKENVGQEFLS